MARPYTLRPLRVGCEVLGFDLTKELGRETVELIKNDVSQHRLLVFRKQSMFSKMVLEFIKSFWKDLL